MDVARVNTNNEMLPIIIIVVPIRALKLFSCYGLHGSSLCRSDLAPYGNIV